MWQSERLCVIPEFSFLLPMHVKGGAGCLCVEPAAESSERGLWEGSQMSFPQEERGCQASAGVYVETIWDVIRAPVWSPHPWHKDEEGRSVTVSLRKLVTWKEPEGQSFSSSLAQRRPSAEDKHLPVPCEIHDLRADSLNMQIFKHLEKQPEEGKNFQLSW